MKKLKRSVTLNANLLDENDEPLISKEEAKVIEALGYELINDYYDCSDILTYRLAKIGDFDLADDFDENTNTFFKRINDTGKFYDVIWDVFENDDPKDLRARISDTIKLLIDENRKGFQQKAT